jgi:hypothetical protein
MISDLRSFMGTVGLLRIYITNYATRAEHIQKLLQGKETYYWGEDQMWSMEERWSEKHTMYKTIGLFTTRISVRGRTSKKSRHSPSQQVIWHGNVVKPGESGKGAKG